MFSGVRFAKVTFIFQKQGAVNFDWLQIPFQTRGFPIQTSNSIGFVDNSMHQINQLVFPDGQLGNEVIMQQNPDFYELIYNLQGNSTAQVSFFVGLCPFNANSTTPQTDYFSSLIEKNSQTYLNTVSNAPLNCFDYQTAIKQWNISYVAITNPDTIPRFLNDPTFELAFKNSEVAIFKIR
jgi:hypothetical protein